MESKYQNKLSVKHQMIRFCYSILWFLTVRWIPRSYGMIWKRFLLQLFGAKIAPTAVVYSSAKIYYPANLEMDEYSCIASDVYCYNVDKIRIGKYATVSQMATLCTASHDITSPSHELTTSPIIIKDYAWIGMRAYVNMGVTINNGGVVGATASVYKNVEEWNIVGGNPAKFIKIREYKNA